MVSTAVVNVVELVVTSSFRDDECELDDDVQAAAAAASDRATNSARVRRSRPAPRLQKSVITHPQCHTRSVVRREAIVPPPARSESLDSVCRVEPPVVGVVGAGQLARMMQPAAIALGIPLRLLAEADGMSAAQVIADTTVGDYTDFATLRAWAEGCAVVT